MNFKRFFLLPCTAIFAFFFSSCVSLQKNASYLPPELESENPVIWRQIAPDVQQYDYKSGKIDYHIVKIDLNTKWQIDSYPRSSEWVKPESVKKFATKNDSIVAINTTPFISRSKLPFSKLKPIGICRENYTEYSGIKSKYCAIAFFIEENGTLRAEIFDSQSELSDKNPVHAFGGFFTIYRNGKFYNFKEIKDVRSAAAVSDNGKTLYLFVGKKLSYHDCAKIFANLNVESAMEFDGGSSSQMTINKKNVFYNIPLRKVAAIFGLKPAK